jgi:hypothetical protein
MWIKFLPYAIFTICGFLGGLLFQAKVLNQKIEIPACPACNCPPATKLELNNFEPQKIKGIKSFTYSPSISGNITIVVDTTQLKKINRPK